jgi:hypothetical protein
VGGGGGGGGVWVDLGALVQNRSFLLLTCTWTKLNNLGICLCVYWFFKETSLLTGVNIKTRRVSSVSNSNFFYNNKMEG